MELKVLKLEDIYKEIADKAINVIKTKTNPVLGLPTGSSPVGVYDLLIDSYKNKKISFKNVTTFNLDEYYPIDHKNEKSYHHYMNIHLFDHVDIDKNNVHFPTLDNNYDALIESKGGIDLQILGIGSNGHIAFNEPNTPFDSLTHLVKLDQSTIINNSRFFNSIFDVPTQAITLGLASILKAKEIVIIVTGKKKAEALKRLLNNEITEAFPASILHKHKNVTIYTDKEAMELC